MHQSNDITADPPAVDLQQILREAPPGLVGVPSVDWMYSAAAESLLAMSHNAPPGSAFLFTYNCASSIAFNRNWLVRQFLSEPHLEWLCFIDSDMIIPPHTVAHLLSTGKDIVSALYFERNPPHPVAALLDDPAGVPRAGRRVSEDFFSLQRVWAVGFGCVLVRRRVFEAIPYPWFDHPRLTPGHDEDFYFCELARNAGFEIWHDGRLPVGHVGTTTVTRDYVLDWWRTREGRATLQAHRAAERAHREAAEATASQP